ncbi:hypothetical protein V8E54_008139 [Elaphomyces granulatus]
MVEEAEWGEDVEDNEADKANKDNGDEEGENKDDSVNDSCRGSVPLQPRTAMAAADTDPTPTSCAKDTTVRTKPAKRAGSKQYSTQRSVGTFHHHSCPPPMFVERHEPPSVAPNVTTIDDGPPPTALTLAFTAADHPAAPAEVPVLEQGAPAPIPVSVEPEELRPCSTCGRRCPPTDFVGVMMGQRTRSTCNACCEQRLAANGTEPRVAPAVMSAAARRLAANGTEPRVAPPVMPAAAADVPAAPTADNLRRYHGCSRHLPPTAFVGLAGRPTVTCASPPSPSPDGRPTDRNPGRIPVRVPPRYNDLGRMDVACPKCHAQHWIAERIGTSRTNPRFNFCCSDGAVNPPPQMMMAWNSNQDHAVQFREHAHRYNNALAFTSVNYLSDSRGGYRPFQIQSRVYNTLPEI